MSTWKINLKVQTAISINGIIFRLIQSNGEYEDVCLTPHSIPPDDRDDVVLERMIKEAGIWYQMELERLGKNITPSHGSGSTAIGGNAFFHQLSGVAGFNVLMVIVDS